MRFWQTLRHGAISVLTFFVVMLGIIALPVSAQTSSDATPAASWGATEATEAAAPLTLVWQSAFASKSSLPSPGDIAIDADGYVYVSTQSMNSVKKFDGDGNFVMEWGGGGDDDGQFSL